MQAVHVEVGVIGEQCIAVECEYNAWVLYYFVIVCSISLTNRTIFITPPLA